MRRRRLRGGAALAAGALALLALGAVMAGGRGEEAPASPETLSRISAKNREAAIDAAARMKADSKAAARAADAKLRSEPEGVEGAANR